MSWKSERSSLQFWFSYTGTISGPFRVLGRCGFLRLDMIVAESDGVVDMNCRIVWTNRRWSRISEREKSTRGVRGTLPRKILKNREWNPIFLLSTYKCRVESARLDDRVSSALRKWEGEFLIKIIVGTQKRGVRTPWNPLWIRAWQRSGRRQSHICEAIPDFCAELYLNIQPNASWRSQPLFKSSWVVKAYDCADGVPKWLNIVCDMY